MRPSDRSSNVLRGRRDDDRQERRDDYPDRRQHDEHRVATAETLSGQPGHRRLGTDR